MRRTLLATALTLAALAALAPAAVVARDAPPGAAPKPARACFYSEDVQNFRQVDDRTVNILANGKQVFQLTLLSNCPDIRDAPALGVRTHGGGQVCDGLDIDLVVASTIGPRTCAVTHMRRLSPEEVAALPKKQMP